MAVRRIHAWRMTPSRLLYVPGWHTLKITFFIPSYTRVRQAVALGASVIGALRTAQSTYNSPYATAEIGPYDTAVPTTRPCKIWSCNTIHCLIGGDRHYWDFKIMELTL